MKIINLIQELELVRLWLENEEKSFSKNYYEYIGFYPGLNPEKNFNALNRGFWSSFIFSHDYDVNFGLRIFPDTPMEKWPVVQNLDSSSAVIFSNSIKTFIPFQQIITLLNKNLFKYVSEDWETIIHLTTPLINLFGTSSEDMAFLKEYAFNPDNEPASSDEDENLSKYLQFWFHYDKTKSHKVLRELIDTLIEDENWLPDSIPNENLGIWETRIKNLLMSRAKSNRIIYGNERIKKFIIEGFSQPHGYDVEHVKFRHYPSSRSSKNSISSIVGYFGLVKDTLPKVFLESHFFNATLKINEDFNNYLGEEHYKAALILESEDKPLEAWNALVSASYWAGVNNSPENVEKHWQAAIKLCEKQNWTDALEALTYQWEWYQEHKK